MMNDELNATIETLVSDLPEDEREQARQILRSCQFQDGRDPALGTLRYLQLRANSVGNKERHLAETVARLGEEIQNDVWETRHMKWGLFAGSVGLAFILGWVTILGVAVHAAKVNPAEMQHYFGWVDPRITQLNEGGVGLEVNENGQFLVVNLKGDMIEGKRGTNGLNVLVFEKRP